MILAFVLAYVLSPVTALLQNLLGGRRTLASLLTYFLLLVLIIAFLVVIIPPLANQMTGLNLDMQRFLLQVETLLGRQFEFAGQIFDIEALFQQTIGSLQGILEPIFGQTLSLAFEAISSIIWVIFIFIISFYLVKDGPALREWLERAVPPDYRQDFIRLRGEISHIWGAFFRGQLVLALVVATIFIVAGFVLGLPFVLAMGVLAGILEFLPSIGHGIWLAAASVLAFFGGSTWLPIPNWAFLLMIVGLHLVYQQFDLNYLIPRIIGRSLHLPPLVIILGIVAGAVFAGVLGILLAAPTIASARVIGRYIFANLFDMDPFPASVAPPLPPPNSRWWHKLSLRKQSKQTRGS